MLPVFSVKTLERICVFRANHDGLDCDDVCALASSPMRQGQRVAQWLCNGGVLGLSDSWSRVVITWADGRGGRTKS